VGSSGWAGCLTKITPDGQILWQTCDTIHWGIPGVLSEETASGHVVLPSGSSILVGFSNRWRPSPARSFGWMMKVDADGCLMMPCTPTDLEEPEFASPGMLLYPNPVDQTLHTLFPAAEESGQLRIFNSFGALAQQIPVYSREVEKTIDVSALPAGVYYLQLANAKRVLLVEKFAVMH
jgi:hypothetical protein